MNATKSRKLTAGNTPTLARVKKAMNGPIYKGTLDAMNAGGEAAAREYLGQFFNDEARQRVLNDFFAA